MSRRPTPLPGRHPADREILRLAGVASRFAGTRWAVTGASPGEVPGSANPFTT